MKAGVFIFGLMLPEKLYPLFKETGKVCTDTRNIIPGSIFFALKGENFNGDNFVDQALEAGCTGAVASLDCNSTDTRVIKVQNTLSTLQELATEYRKSFTFPVLGITGSNGKTTSKELIRDVLARKYKVHATKGNLNNHIGVPLTLLSTPADCEFAIIEMGANHQREIAALSAIAQPDYGFITNIGKAHLEGFGGPEGVLKGKKELFDHIRQHGGTAFVNTALQHLSAISEGMERVLYGSDSDQNYFEVLSADPALDLNWVNGDEKYKIHTQLAGAYNVHNVAAAAVIGGFFGVEASSIVDAIELYNPENNRSQWYQGTHNKLILDAYNANPNSMEAALRNLKLVGQGNGLAIIGDMKEMGEHSFEEHRKIIDLIKELQVDAVLIGPDFGKALYNDKIQHFNSTADAHIALKEKEIKDRIVLLKGSRSMGLEQLKELF